MTVDEISEIAQKHDKELREYRLSGDLTYLYGFLEELYDFDSARSESKIQEFKENATKNEIKALQCIIQEIGSEGNISVVKLIQHTPHSRPVYTSLLSKIQKYKIAVVEVQGVKGTYVKFLCNIKELM